MYPHQHIHLDGEPANRILRKSANIKLYTILDPKKKKKSANILIPNITYKK